MPNADSLILAAPPAATRAVKPLRRRLGRPFLGGKWRRSNAICTAQKHVHELLAIAEHWRAGADDAKSRGELLRQTQIIREVITGRLLSLRGFYGLSRRQRVILEEMISALECFDAALDADLNIGQKTELLARVNRVLDDRHDQSQWPILMMRYRFWPSGVQSHAKL